MGAHPVCEASIMVIITILVFVMKAAPIHEGCCAATTEVRIVERFILETLYLSFSSTYDWHPYQY